MSSCFSAKYVPQQRVSDVQDQVSRYICCEMSGADLMLCIP